MKKVILIFIISAIYFILVKSFISIYYADIYYARSRDFVGEVQFSNALKFANKTLEQNPLEPAYYRGRAKVLILSALYSLKEDDKLDLKKEAYEDLQSAFNLNVNNLATIRNSIPLYYYLSLKTLDGSNENLDWEYLQKTKYFFDFIEKEYPNDVGALVDVAKYQRKLDLTEDFDNTLKMISNLRADLLDWNEDLR